jgi:MFS transporter, FSR family, fosmidomycin resistance protein
LDSTAASSFRKDARVIGVVGTAHATSHFFQLVLPPLFPLLRAEFGVSYATLGALVSVFYAASGICQFGAGFAVDRFGARPVLLGGLSLLAGGVLLGGIVPDFYWLFPLVFIMGIGNGVFHPADFAILNANVNVRRLGHAYSTHGIGGSLGYALAPVASFGLASAFGWRASLLILGAAGLVGMALLATQRKAMTSRAHDAAAPKHTLANSIELFRQPAILLCFGYFCTVTVAVISIQTFIGTSLHTAYDVPLAVATSALTAYLLFAAAGILFGGFLASHTQQHDRVAATGLAAGAALMLLLALVPAVAQWAIVLLAAIGFSLGATGPSRDMIVRKATPPGASGRVYGFVYSGLDLGATLAPVSVGLLLDHNLPRAVFVAIAVALLLAVSTVVQVRRSPRASSTGTQAAD